MSLLLSPSPTAGTLRRAFQTNVVPAAFTSPAVCLTALPTVEATQAEGTTSADGWFVFPQAQYANLTNRCLLVVPFGAGSSIQTFTLRVTLWFACGQDAGTRLYVPSLVIESLCTLGTVVGLSGKVMTNTDRLCSAIADSTAGVGTKVTDYAVLSTGATGGGASTLAVSLRGAAAAQVQIGTTATAASGNALVGLTRSVSL